MINVLENIKKVVEELTKDLKLEKPPENNAAIRGKANIMDYELVKPAVYIGWVPNEGLEEYEGLAPSITVMFDGGEDSDNENITTDKIRLGILTYDPGTTTEEEIKLNAKGYKDLLNIICVIKREIKSKLKGYSISKIKWNMPQEQKYPYWVANLTFNLELENIQRKSKEITEFL